MENKNKIMKVRILGEDDVVKHEFTMEEGVDAIEFNGFEVMFEFEGDNIQVYDKKYGTLCVHADDNNDLRINRM